MWHVQANSHDARDYDVVPPPRPVGQLRITLAWLLDSVERHLKAFVKPTEPFSTPARTIKRDHDRGFTTLGKRDIDPQRQSPSERR